MFRKRRKCEPAARSRRALSLGRGKPHFPPPPPRCAACRGFPAPRQGWHPAGGGEGGGGDCSSLRNRAPPSRRDSCLLLLLGATLAISKGHFRAVLGFASEEQQQHTPVSRAPPPPPHANRQTEERRASPAFRAGIPGFPFVQSRESSPKETFRLGIYFLRRSPQCPCARIGPQMFKGGWEPL